MEACIITRIILISQRWKICKSYMHTVQMKLITYFFQRNMERI